MLRSLLRPVKAIAGAVMLGFGTLFQPKTRPDDHWSASPKVQVVVEDEADGASVRSGAGRRSGRRGGGGSSR